MKLLNKLGEYIEISNKRKEFEQILKMTLSREIYRNFDKEEEILVPHSIREAYFELFKDKANQDSIVSDQYLPLFLATRSHISFLAVSQRGANLVLTYGPAHIDLEISKYSFNNGHEIRELGLISTIKEGDDFTTNLNVNSEFLYNHGYSANHDISDIINKIQNQEVIPRFSKIDLFNLPEFIENGGMQLT